MQFILQMPGQLPPSASGASGATHPTREVSRSIPPGSEAAGLQLLTVEYIVI